MPRNDISKVLATPRMIPTRGGTWQGGGGGGGWRGGDWTFEEG